MKKFNNLVAILDQKKDLMKEKASLNEDELKLLDFASNLENYEKYYNDNFIDVTEDNFLEQHKIFMKSIEEDTFNSILPVGKPLHIIKHLKWIPEAKPGQKALDLGCHDGIVTTTLHKLGYEATGVDIIKRVIDLDNYVNDKLYDGKINYVESSIEEFQSDSKYDIIYIADVLEHVIDFDAVYDKILSLLADNGKLIIVNPVGWEHALNEDEHEWEHLRTIPVEDFERDYLNVEVDVKKYMTSDSDSVFRLEYINITKKEFNSDGLITLNMIVRDNADIIEKCLASFEPYVDKIVIIDTGSVDNTVEVCRGFSDKVSVYDFEWVDDFSAARNFALSKVDTQWAMYADSDDILLCDAGPDYFRNLIKNTKEQAFRFNYHYFVKHSGALPDLQNDSVRLWSMNHEPIWSKPIHETLNFKEFINYNSIPLLTEAVWEHDFQYVESKGPEHQRTSRNLRISLANKNLDKSDFTSYDSIARGFCADKEYKIAATIWEQMLEIFPEDLVGGPDHMKIRMLIARTYNEFDSIKAENFIKESIIVNPEYATENLSLLGTIYLERGDFILAESVLKETLDKLPPKQTNASQTMLYGHYNYIKLINALYAQDKLEEAYKYLNIAISKYGASTDLIELDKNISAQLDRSIEHKTRYNVRKYTNKKIILVNPASTAFIYDPNNLDQALLGGSEIALFEVSKRLSRLGHEVIVYGVNFNKESITEDGTIFRPFTQWSPQEACDVLISSRVPEIFEQDTNSKINILWQHDWWVPISDRALNNITKVFVLSNASARYIKYVKGVPEDKVYVTQNGIDLRDFDVMPKKNPNKLCFVSSPVRGLDALLFLFDDLQKEFKDLELHIFYGNEGLPETAPGYEQCIALEKKAKKMDGVTWHGKTPHKEVIEHIKESVLWVHPSRFLETSCISAMEMQAAMVPYVSTDAGAMEETLYDEAGYKYNYSNFEEEYVAWYNNILNSSLELLRDEQLREELGKKGRLFAYTNFSWDKVITDWDRLFEEI